MSQRPIRILFLCLGNICRSPIAHGVCEAMLDARGQSHAFVVDSAGTSAHHAGERPDPGSIRVCGDHGLDISHQRSRPLTSDDLETMDFIVAMDRRNLSRISSPLPAERALLLRAFDPEAGPPFEVPDPWGGGARGFDDVYAMVTRSMDGLLAHALAHGPRAA